GGQYGRHEPAMAYSSRTDLGTHAALTPAECFGVCATCVVALCMLMRPDQRRIYIVHIPVEGSPRVGLLLDRRKEARPDPRLAPAIKAARDGSPWAIALRQVAPRGASAEEPEDTIEDAAVVGGWAACFGLLRGKQRL